MTTTRRREGRRGIAPSTSTLSFLTFIPLICIISYLVTNAFQQNSIVGASFALNSLLSIAFLIAATRRHDYSLELSHWLFVVTFFVIAPLFQYKQGYFPWGLTTDIDVHTLSANSVVLTWCLAWIVVRAAVSAPSSTRGQHRPNCAVQNVRNQDRKGHPGRVSLFALVGLLYTSYKLATVGMAGLLLRGAATDALAANARKISPTAQLADSVGRTSALAAVLLASRYMRINDPKFLFLAALALTANFPLATPRYWTASVAIAVIALSGGFRRRGALTFSVLVGLFLVMPVLLSLIHI